jgi:hypothetical protein
LTVVGVCFRSWAVANLLQRGVNVEQTRLEIRFRDTRAYVVPESDPWRIVTKEDEVIEWRVLLFAPDLTSSPFAFAAYEDVEYLRRESVVPVPMDLELRLIEAFDASEACEAYEPSESARHNVSVSHAELQRRFRELAEHRGLDPTTVEAFDAAVEEGVLHSLALYNSEEPIFECPIEGYVADIDTLRPNLPSGWKPATFTSEGTSTFWNWRNPKLGLTAAATAATRECITYRTRKVDFPVPFSDIRAAENT